MSSETYERIRSNPKFQQLVSARSRFAWALSAVVLVGFYGFVMVVAFAPAVIGTRIGGSMLTVGVASGLTMFVGFWLHPIGYILANSYFCYMCWGSLLAAWAVKWVGLKIGGPRAVREKMTPFFGGVFVGCVAGMLFWDVVALVGQARGVTDVFTCFP